MVRDKKEREKQKRRKGIGKDERRKTGKIRDSGELGWGNSGCGQNGCGGCEYEIFIPPPALLLHCHSFLLF